MVLAHYFQKWADKKFREWDERREAKAHAEGYAQGYDEGYPQGFAEGVAEVNKEWRDWLTRYEEAESRGERFLEPPPNHRA